MKVFFDTNIILDVLLAREPFVELSAILVSLAEEKEIKGYLCATTLTTIDYLIAKEHNREKAKTEVSKLLGIFHICSVNKQVLQLSLNSTFKDFEDAVQFYSGVSSNVDSIVTRNTKDYQADELSVYTPDELWSIVQLEK
ncbi:MAG: PIN domain-containing protein [Gammaproteobacteria bacterium]